ncbi:MAG: heavy-metal-associated domain-containing protein [Patescibacteria group bacterium]
MLNFFKKNKNQAGTVATLRINGMHCTSCSMSIDGELEDLTGVNSATTSYAKAETKVEYDSEKVNLEKIKKTIEALGYKVEE